MTWTWEQVISLALVRSKRVGRNQPIAAEDISVGKEALNLVLDKLDGQGLALPSFSTNITFNTVPLQAKYLLGPGSGAAYTVRPESIITATCQTSSNPIVRVAMTPLTYEGYTTIWVPSNPGLPWNYAVNQTFPQMEVYLYPNPNTIYPIVLNCKVKWAATAGDPNTDWFAVAQVPSGYASALVDIIALEIAEIDEIQSQSLKDKADYARFVIASAVARQQPMSSREIPIGIFGNNVIMAGRNP